jgi:hypothetical protein
MAFVAAFTPLVNVLPLNVLGSIPMLFNWLATNPDTPPDKPDVNICSKLPPATAVAVAFAEAPVTIFVLPLVLIHLMKLN